MKPTAYAILQSGEVLSVELLQKHADWMAERIDFATVEPLFMVGAGANNATASTLRTWAESGEAVELSADWLNNVASEIALLESVVLSQEQSIARYRKHEPEQSAADEVANWLANQACSADEEFKEADWAQWGKSRLAEIREMAERTAK